MSEENTNTTSASANAAEQKRCRVAVVDGFGAPRDVIRIEERACKVEPPAPDHVRVQVLAASINRGDLYVCLGEPYPIRFAGIVSCREKREEQKSQRHLAKNNKFYIEKKPIAVFLKYQ